MGKRYDLTPLVQKQDIVGEARLGTSQRRYVLKTKPRPPSYVGRQDGYGSNIPTRLCMWIDGRWHRVYSHCWGTGGAMFVVRNGKRLCRENTLHGMASSHHGVRHA